VAQILDECGRGITPAVLLGDAVGGALCTVIGNDRRTGLLPGGLVRPFALADPRYFSYDVPNLVPLQSVAKRIGTLAYQDIITIEPGKRGGRPTVPGTRIAVVDVLGWLGVGMTHQQIVDDYPELTEDHIRACLAYAADRGRRLVIAARWNRGSSPRVT
jgi:uncharacterized protein (DUF433 family)